MHDVPDRYELSGLRNDGIAIHFSGTRRHESSPYPETIRIRCERADIPVDTYDQANERVIEHEKVEAHEANRVIIHPRITDYDIRFKEINRDWVDTMNGSISGYLTDQDLSVNSMDSVRLQGKKTLIINPITLLSVMAVRGPRKAERAHTMGTRQTSFRTVF